jgi:hypothetical protein
MEYILISWHPVGHQWNTFLHNSLDYFSGCGSISHAFAPRLSEAHANCFIAQPLTMIIAAYY